MDLSRRAILGAAGAAALSKIILPFKPRAEDLIVPSKIVPFGTIPDANVIGPGYSRLYIAEGGCFRIDLPKDLKMIHIEHPVGGPVFISVLGSFYR